MPCEKSCSRNDGVRVQPSSGTRRIRINMSLGGEKNNLESGSVATMRSRSIKITFSGVRMFANRLCHMPMCSSGLISQIAISFINGQCDMGMALFIPIDMPI